jgi:ppGpp synthetase/RelA/SpoT-type nucleotidyltranferase
VIIPSSINQKYLELFPAWERVKEESDTLLGAIAEKVGGFYTSRIKKVESAMLKIEKGEPFVTLETMDDMVAGTIVVQTVQMIPKARIEVESAFELQSVKPLVAPKPDVFAGHYDLHLIVKLKDSPFRAEKKITQIPFEIQIKTFLQEAWAQAGHDIIYKGKRPSYGLVRISSQVRALLELADAVLANIEQAASLQVEPSYDRYEKLRKIIDILEKYWSEDRLPIDRRRAAFVIERYLKLAGGITAEDLDSILNKTDYSEFLRLRSVTPTQIIFIVLFLDRSANMSSKITGDVKVLITDEMLDFCPSLASIPVSNRV